MAKKVGLLVVLVVLWMVLHRFVLEWYKRWADLP
jgi:hypothetical protein